MCLTEPEKIVIGGIQRSENILYHYTSINTLMGIETEKKIWMTNSYYMNDATEIKFALEILKRLKNELQQEFDDSCKDFIEEIFTWCDCLLAPHNIFIFCLTENGNLLSQWRSYTPHGKGISIGFNKEKLNERANKYGFDLIKCVYERDEQKKLILDSLRSIIQTFQGDKDEIDVTGRPEKQKYYDYLGRFKSYLLKVFSVIKNPVFGEECEWRIISKYYPSYTIPEIKFREGKTMIMPYIEFDISNLCENGYLFDIVIIGPSPHLALAFNSLSNYLSNKNICSRLMNSMIPYREI